MAGVWDANVIDVVAQDANGDVAVVMVEERPWDAEPEQPDQLRKKMSLYASWILDGDLVAEYPGTAGRPVRIQLDCVQAPTAEITALIDFARNSLNEYGVDVVVHVRG